MAYDPYTAVWLSHSSLTDFLSCHRLYYLKNVFKDPISKRRINLTSPYLSLGVAIHNSLERLKNIDTDKREKEIKENLLINFKKEWQNFTGKKGGFKNSEEERKFFERGEKILERIIQDPKILLNKIIKEDYFWKRKDKNDFNPHYPFSEEHNFVLNGAIDWMEYLEKENAIRIVDFKTGRNDENEDSFQLPIYYLLIDNLDKKKKYKISEVAYWYLDYENKKESSVHDELQIIKIDDEKIKDISEKEKQILEIGIQIKNFREAKNYKCNNETLEGEGCRQCQDFEKVYKFIQNRELEKREGAKTIQLEESEGQSVEFVGVSDYNQDLYFIQ